ncbi:MAG: amidohydrolase [Candidatus Cloacimonadota bacterium]|nr:amidohydrolase [Candidatus Cloacimonadota bacterium]
MILNLTSIRHKIHKNPELSGIERKTANYLVQILKKLSFRKIMTSIGGYGVIAVFDSKKPGSTIMFRAELDALPITELNELSYRSKNVGISHKCGHDGHIAILIGLAEKISSLDYKGKIILLFQPAEETAKGAIQVLKDENFKSLKPDYIFALHNLPGFTKGSIILKKGNLTSTSIGMIINLFGQTSHAGHPENGNNPTPAMIEIIDHLIKLPNKINDSALTTVIYAKLGEIAFGTSAGKAVIMITLRSHSEQILNNMKEIAISFVQEISLKYNLDQTIEWVEYFPEIINDDKCVKIIKKSAHNINKEVEFIKKPFSWTEDFSYFTQNIKGAFFGLGAGTEHPQLHTSDYDFPDDIIEDGVNIFVEIIKEIGRR